jgi:hypothetical protein
MQGDTDHSGHHVFLYFFEDIHRNFGNYFGSFLCFLFPGILDFGMSWDTAKEADLRTKTFWDGARGMGLFYSQTEQDGIRRDRG